MAKLVACSEIGCDSVELAKTCTFPADPDIAGIGIVLSFFISVTLSLLLAVYGFYFIKGSYITNQLNTLDLVITRPVNAIIGKFSKSEKSLITREVFREVILTFSDQQLITGLAILTVAFWRFKSITEYHFAVVSDLANMALIVQFTACDILGEVLRERPEMVWWRVIAFVILAVLSMITLVPWGNQYFLYTYGSEMACLWDKTSGNYVPKETAQMTLYMVLSVWGIIDVLSKYFPVITENRIVKGIRDTMVGALLWPRRRYIFAQQSTNTSLIFKAVRCVMYGLPFLVFSISEIVYAEALALIRNWAMLLVNVIDVFWLRSTASENGRQGNEDAWGFGQAVPMFMLILPLCTLFELYWDGYFRRKVAETEGTEGHPEVLELQNVEDQAFESTVADVHDDSGRSISRQRLVAPLRSSSRGSSPAPGHSQATAPGLSVSDDTNSGNYYFSYPAAKMGSTDFEDRLYGQLWFRVILFYFMAGLLVLLSVLAGAGWAI